MEVVITWHLSLVILISFILILFILKGGEDSLDFSSFIWAIILVVIWLIYGGIFLW